MTIFLDCNREQWKTAQQELPSDSVLGQLLTPLTRYKYRGGPFAIDNGAFAGFDRSAFDSLLRRNREHRAHCRFVTVPDVVGSARRTNEVFDAWRDRLWGWPLAYVAQDGIENLPIPWGCIAAVFIGGSTAFKLSDGAAAVVRAAQALDKWVHVGRVNTPERYDRFLAMGVNSIDGSGISQYTHMRENLDRGNPLFEGQRLTSGKPAG